MAALHYLAYGSNLHPLRLRERVRSATLLGVTKLSGMQLRFHKRSDDGSGKCDLLPGDASDLSYAAIYQIDPAQMPLLDQVEGLGSGYEQTWIECQLSNRPSSESIRAFAYAASASHIDPQLRPYDWYRSLVIAGARFHRFPRDYLEAIEGVPSVSDPDPARIHLNQGLLQRIRDFSLN